jgi:DNA-binding MarR family transcriptional regulator
MSGTQKKPKTSRVAMQDATRVWLRIMACNNLIQAEIRNRLRDEFGTTLPRFDVLAQIDRPPQGPTMGELSERLMVTKANITDMMGRLEAENLVLRKRSGKDARISHVYLTAKGKRALDGMLAAHQVWLAGLMQDLGPRDMTFLYDILGRLKTSLKQAPTSRSSRRKRREGDDDEAA